jgi:hypothetical protein
VEDVMNNLTLVAVFALGALVGWGAHELNRSDEAEGPEEIVVQHPQPNPFGVGSTKTRIKLYSVGDTTFGAMPEGTTNATHWIVTINGVNYRGVAKD